MNESFARHLKTPSPQVGLDQPLAAVLRAATAKQHAGLHDHPLIAELLTRGSPACYRAVLSAFLRFYRPVEPALVECARRFGAVEQYPWAMRTERLLADLRSLGCDYRQLAVASDHQLAPRLRTLGDLIGCLYVVKGSALGGRTILARVADHLCVEHCCRFFTGDPAGTGPSWRAFQRFCNAAGDRDEIRRAAVLAARRTFKSLEECLNESLEEHRVEP